MKNNGDRQRGAAEQFLQFPLRVEGSRTLSGSSSVGPRILSVNKTTNTTSTKDSNILPEHHTLVVDTASGSVTLVDWQSGRFLAQSRLSEEQLPFLILLLESWPFYVPYEKFFPLLNIEMTGQLQRDLDRVKRSGQEGQSEHEEVLDAEARKRIQPIVQPIRTLLSSCRPNLQAFGLTIAAIMDCGPILLRHAPLQNVLKDQEIGGKVTYN